MNRIIKGLESRTYPLRIWMLDKFGTDEQYLKCMFFHRLGYRLNLKNPKSFNEKLQWMKLYDSNPLYSLCADKVAVRKYVSERIGEDYLIPCLGVYDRAEDIDYSLLPNRFVLKCNHGAKYNIICKDKATFNTEKANEELNNWLKEDFWKIKREYHYKRIKPMILCEKYMEDNETGGLNDYKVFMISGEPYMIQVDLDRYGDHKRNIYDKDWNLLDVEISFPRSYDCIVKKPKVLDEMIDCAKALSKGFNEVRVDFYIINNKLFFGELTFFSGAGFSIYNPRKFEFDMGEKLELNKGV